MQRSAIEIELGGRKRYLSLDLNATIALASLTGEDLGDVLSRIVGGGDAEIAPDSPDAVKLRAKRNLERVKAIRLLTRAMLTSSSPELEEDPHSLTTVGEWLTMDKLSEVAEGINKLMSGLAGPPEFEGQLAPFVPTPTPVVSRMIELAEITDDSLVIDLGAGDGRLLFAAAAAAERVTALGYEAHVGRLDALRERIGGHRYQQWVTVKQCDIQAALDQNPMRHEIGMADVVFLYLLDSSNMLLRDRLRERMKPGARIVSHDFHMGDWKPEKTAKVECEDRTHTVYVWRIPER